MPSVKDVVRNARTRDSTFTEKRQTVRSALAILSPWQDRIVSKLASRSPDVVVEADPIEVDLPLDDFAAGAELQEAFLRIFDGDVQVGRAGKERWIPFELLDPGARSAFHSRPGGWIRGSRLYLIGGAGDWSGATQIRLWWVARAAALPAADAKLAVPDDVFSEDAAAAHLAWKWASRAPKEVHRPVASFEQDAREAEEEMIWQALERVGVRRGYRREG